jgi:hypothetical protein
MTNKNLSTNYPTYRKAKTNIIGRLNKIKNDIERIIPEMAPISNEEIINLLAVCRRYYEGKLHWGRVSVPENHRRVRELTTVQNQVYKYLREEWSKFSPSTIYRWGLSGRLPSDIMDSLEQGKIGQVKALKLAQNRFERQKNGQAIVIIDLVAEAVENMT